MLRMLHALCCAVRRNLEYLNVEYFPVIPQDYENTS